MWIAKCYKRELCFVCVIVFFSISLAISTYLRISVTNSAKYRVFWKKSKCSFRKGEYAEVKVSETDPYVPDPEYNRLIKRIVCLPGEVIEKRGLDYYCNGRFIARAKLKTKDGRPLTPWIPSIKFIPENKYFMANSNKDSYDSRYLGLIDKEEIINCLDPVF